MGLYLASLFSGIIFQFPLQCIESVSDHNIRIFMLIPVDHDLGTRYGEVDLDVEQLSLMVAPL
jgi:hypothetical protein